MTVSPQFTPGEISATGQTICYNTSPTTAIGSSTDASGGDGAITYYWRSSANSYSASISGATNSTYTPAGPLTSTTSYRRYAKDGTCNTTPTVATGTWTVTVRPDFNSGTIASTGETICYNTNPANAIGSTTVASGGDGVITYSWRSSADAYIAAINGATNATFTPAGPLTSTTSYRRYAKDGACTGGDPTAFDNTTGLTEALLLPSNSTSLATSSRGLTFTTGNSSIKLKSFTFGAYANAAGTANIGIELYQGNGNNGTLKRSISAQSFNLVTIGSGGTKITWTIDTVWTLQPNTQYTLVVTNGSAGTQTPRLAVSGLIESSWVKNGLAFDQFTNGNTASPDKFYVQLKTETNNFIVSDGTWQVTVRPQFTAGAIQTTGQTICYNTDPSIIGNTTDASGGDGTITYKWQSSANGAFTDAVEIGTATGTTYDPPALTSTTTFRRMAHDGTCNTTFTASTGTWTVTVRPDFTSGTIATTGETICYNTNPATAIGNSTSASGGDQTITYSWRSSDDNYAAAITGATNSTYLPAGPLTSTTSYRRYAKDGTCNTTPTVSTGTWTVTVRFIFTSGAIATTGETICYNTNPASVIGNTTSAGGGDQAITYSWRSSADSYATDIASASSSTYTPAGPLTSTTSYRRYAKDGTCNTMPTVSTGTWTVTVRPDFTSGTIATTGETICYNTNPATAIGNTTSAGGGDQSLTYSWRSSADSYVTDIASATSSTYTPAGPLTSTTSYRRYAKDGTCNTTPTVSTGTWTVTVRPNFTSGAVATTGETICYNTNPATSIGSTTDAGGGDQTITYSWRSSADSYASAITGATNSTYTPAGPLTTTTSYRRYAKDGTCNTTPSVSTGTWTVTVRPNFTSGAIATTGETICFGSDPAAISNQTSADGGDLAIAYQWQLSTTGAGSGYTNITGASSSGYDPPAGLTTSTWYRRLAKEGICNPSFTASTGTWKVTVDPTTVGGSVTGGVVVCYGLNSTLLTLSGHTGTVQYWQYSVNGSSWTDIPAATSTTYTAVNLTVNTYYRAVVKSGVCLVENSASTQITVFSDYKISGYAKYNNNPKTPLDGLKITLKQGTTTIGTPYVTGTNGYYQFTGLVNGNYKLEIASASPTGTWQTWSGVNNTDYLLVAKHAAGTALLPETPPVIRVAGDVLTPHPVINTADANAIRAAATFGWGNPAYFDIPKWVFSGLTAATPLTDIQLTCANVTRDILGLCAGDVNGTAVPGSGVKTLDATSLQIVNQGVLPVTNEMIFPVAMVKTTDALSLQPQQQLGAITLMLDFDPAKIEITGVEMPDNEGVEPWFEVRQMRDAGYGIRDERGILNIGWMSLKPVNVVAGQPILLIHARLVMDPSSPIPDPATHIRFTLNDNPLSELANGDGNVVFGAKLLIPDAGQLLNIHNSLVSVYPNPASRILNIEYVMDKSGDFAAELVSLQGQTVGKITSTCNAGQHKTTMNVQDLPNGAYMLKMHFGEQTEVRKVVINR